MRETPQERSALYLKAAQRFASRPGVCKGMCSAIVDVGGRWALCDRLASYFKPTEREVMAAGFSWRSPYWGDHWGSRKTKCRILALCLMAAIAADEEPTKRKRKRR